MFAKKKTKTCFIAQIGVKDTQEHLLIALFFLIVLTHEVDFGISNKKSARALIEGHMHLLGSKNNFFFNSEKYHIISFKDCWI